MSTRFELKGNASCNNCSPSINYFKSILIFSEQVSAENLELEPYESLVLLQNIDDDDDTNSTTTTTTESPDDTDNISTSLSANLLMLLVALVGTACLNLL